MDFCSVSPFDCLLFDLDDTLYPLSTGIAAACKRNIEDFLVEKFGFSKEKASNVRIELFRSYGSTLAGLRALGYDIGADDYHSFVHGRLPYDAIKPDPRLRNLLKSIVQRKLQQRISRVIFELDSLMLVQGVTSSSVDVFEYGHILKDCVYVRTAYTLREENNLKIFTNSDKNHAIKVLERLGLLDCFEQIISFETINPNLPNSTRLDEFPIVLKPSIEAIKTAIIVSDVDPRRTLFLDDNPRNIAAGKSMGLSTVLVGKQEKSQGADYAVENVVNLRKVVPEIWARGSDGGDQRIALTRSEIDAVLAATTVGA